MEKQNQEMPKGTLTGLFNNLSLPGRLQLRAAAMTNALTGIIRDDTKRHPWAFPLYAAYLVLLTIPLPTFGIATGLAVLGAVCAASLNNSWSRWIRGRLKESFNKEAVAGRLRDFIVRDETRPGQWRVDSWALTKHTSRESWRDTFNAAAHAYGRLLKPAVNKVNAAWRRFLDR
jgi:hypothetical protein